jgi:hypothetical protein
VDGCNADPASFNVTYPQLGRYLNATGRPIIYSCRSAGVTITEG